MARTFAGDAKAFGALAKDLKGDGLERINREVGAEAKRIAAAAASADLGGDTKHSGWGIPLDTKYRALRSPDQGVVISPTKTSAGPWTVAQQGRNRGAGGFAGPGANRRTGRTSAGVKAGTSAVRANSRGGKQKRWNGYTDGKGTASSASGEFARRLPGLVEKGIFLLTKRHLGG